MSGKGIAVAGSLVADTFHYIETYPDEGMQTHIVRTDYYVGGIGNNTIQLAHIDPTLPIKVSAIAGLDEGGDRSARMLGEYPNIDLTNLTREGESSHTLVMNALDTKQRTFFSYPSSSNVYCEDYVDWDAIDADILQLEYLTGLARLDEDDDEYGTKAARMLSHAQERGMKTSIDLVSRKNDRARYILRCALKYTDYCIINELETELATGMSVMTDGELDGDKALEALQSIAKMGASTWAVIHSPHASAGYDCKTGEFYMLPSLKIAHDEILGTNGAGDAFNSGCLYQAYKGEGLEMGLRFATATAGMSLLGLNGYAALKPEADIWAFEAERRAME